MMDRNKRFWCLDEYKGETSPIVDGKFAPTNEWLCNKLNELVEEIEVLKQRLKIYKSDGLETVNDLERAYENNAKALSNIERLEEENKELKAKVDDKEVAVEVECEKLMQKVFEVIDKSLEKDKQYYEMTYEDYLNGRIEALEELKKELIMI